jgi:hypothetical protein
MQHPRVAAAAAIATLALAAAPALGTPPGGPRPSDNGATVRLAKTSAKPGGGIRVSGRRFPARKDVTVKLDDDRVGIVAVFSIDSKGRFSGTVKVPRNVTKLISPGRHWLRFLAPASKVNGQSNTSIKKTFTLKRR